ncbi:hypothetical protein LP420_06425 [Massilia sp. B-10]|nr:hypothetical protein LP420_06425 [Massilia sp. B-10]
MLNFERSSLNKKLTIISFLSTGTALLFVFVAFTVTSVLNHRKDEGMQLSSFMRVIGANSVDALTFNDRSRAHKTLAALRAKDEISSAALFGRNGAVFAHIRPPRPGRGRSRHAGGRSRRRQADPGQSPRQQFLVDQHAPLPSSDRPRQHANRRGHDRSGLDGHVARRAQEPGHDRGRHGRLADGGDGAGQPLQGQHCRSRHQADQCRAEGVGQPELQPAHFP